MKKLVIFMPLFFNLNGQAQNIIQNNSFLNVSNISQAQSQQLYASNIMVNNITNKPQEQRVSNRVQRQTRRTESRNNVASNPMIQQFSIHEINDDIQVQGNIVAIENNAGNAFGNERNPIEQIASFDIPAIQLGSGNLNINMDLDITMPKINLKSMKFSGRGSSSSTGNHHKLSDLKKKWAKFNRKASGKLSFRKKMKIKVDNCFKW